MQDLILYEDVSNGTLETFVFEHGSRKLVNGSQLTNYFYVELCCDPCFNIYLIESLTGNRAWRVCSCTNNPPEWETSSAHNEARFTLLANMGTQV